MLHTDRFESFAGHDFNTLGVEEKQAFIAELEAFVIVIVDDAEYHFGRASDAALREAYAREAVFDLWLACPGLTVSAARHVLNHVRATWKRRTINGHFSADRRPPGQPRTSSCRPCVRDSVDSGQEAHMIETGTSTNRSLT
jgi:hypothetical protein